MKADTGVVPMAYETRVERVLVGRLARGTDLFAALDALADKHGLRAGWISALGAFEWIDIVEYDQDAKKYDPPIRVHRCELLSLVGNVSMKEGAPFWHVHATLSHVGEGRDKVYGGHVIGAQVFAMEYRVECYADISLVRELDGATGLPLWPCGDAGADADAGTGAGTGTDAGTDAGTGTASAAGWAAAIDASSQVAQVERDAEAQPVQSDYIDHGKFGLCRVDLIKGDMMVIRLPDGTRKKLKPSFLRFSGRRMHGPKVVFTAEKR